MSTRGQAAIAADAAPRIVGRCGSGQDPLLSLSLFSFFPNVDNAQAFPKMNEPIGVFPAN